MIAKPWKFPARACVKQLFRKLAEKKERGTKGQRSGGTRVRGAQVFRKES